MTELERLRRFEWNVLQAYERGGEGYLWSAVDWLVRNPEYTELEVERGSFKKYEKVYKLC